jgi:hypothetical protein
MGRIVIVAYKPKPGCSDDLQTLCREHVPILRQEGLATSREPILAVAADDIVVEIFEWVSADAIESAHNNVRVQQMWARFGSVCDYIPIGSVREATKLFSEFTPLTV